MCKTGVHWTLLLIVLIPSLAFADTDLPQLKNPLPRSQRHDVGTKAKPDERECFAFEEYKLLLQMGFDLEESTQLNKEYELKLDLQEDMIKNFEEMTETQKNIILLQDRQKERLFGLWQVENQKRHEAEEKVNKVGWISWTMIGLSVATNLVLLGLALN